MSEGSRALLPHRLPEHALSRPADLGFRIAARNGRSGTELTGGAVRADGRHIALALRSTDGRSARVGLACQEPRISSSAWRLASSPDIRSVPLLVALSRRSAPRLGVILRAAALDAVLIGSNATDEDWLLDLIGDMPHAKVTNARAVVPGRAGSDCERRHRTDPVHLDRRANEGIALTRRQHRHQPRAKALASAVEHAVRAGCHPS